MPHSTDSARAAARLPSLPTLGEALPAISERFTRQGALGILVIDATPLADIERDSGYDAYRSSLSALAELARDVVGRHLIGDELVTLSDTGHHEVLIHLFRQCGNGDFYRTELPEFQRALDQALEQGAQRVVYPYFRRAPVFGTGYAATLRNPDLGAATQIRGAFREAREDARLVAQVEARRRRKEFVGLVFAGRVTSVYEPIVDVATKTVFGYEALARGPEGSDFHAPLVLFQNAVKENLVFELDCLCRRSGLEGARGLPAGTKLFLNVRPTTIHDPNFKPEALIRTLEHSQLQPSDLVLEVSEQESIHSFDVFREVRDEYGKLGFQFALDDTGAGYASLEAVMELAPEFIKVDRAFVRDIDKDPARRTLLRALNAVAEDTGARIIAEGLDRLEELETLGEMNIPFGQGWLFGKPTPLRAK